MIDISTEQLVTLREATTLIPGRVRGRKLHHSTLWRWCLNGVRGVVLESVQIGGTRCTSREALARFAAACSVVSGIEQPANRTPAQRRRDHEKACAQLDAAGIK